MWELSMISKIIFFCLKGKCMQTFNKVGFFLRQVIMFLCLAHSVCVSESVCKKYIYKYPPFNEILRQWLQLIRSRPDPSS